MNFRVASILFGSIILGFYQHESLAQPDEHILVGAGDIVECDTEEDEATAKLLDTISGTIFTTGDNVYDRGTDSEFQNCYEPSWGRHRLRTRPSPGNHDYYSSGAAPYFKYFGAQARGEKSDQSDKKGYYKYNVGSWNIFSLNSNLKKDEADIQAKWLDNELGKNPTACTVAYWHHPLFSTGKHGDSRNKVLKNLWEILYKHGVEIVLTGHDHHYERFIPLAPDGKFDLKRGIQQFIVGTGGTKLRKLYKTPIGSVIRNDQAHGVLKLTLHSNQYEWEFIPIAGQTFTDKGKAYCVTPKENE